MQVELLASQLGCQDNADPKTRCSTHTKRTQPRGNETATASLNTHTSRLRVLPDRFIFTDHNKQVSGHGNAAWKGDVVYIKT